ncbi:MAG: efflux RND transporter permease subunit [Pseudomonadota bacterium]
MSRVILAALQYRKITLLFTVAIALYGLFSYYVMPKQENPETSPPVALITTVYPGGAPEDVEQLVSKPIEDAVAGIDSFDHVMSWSRNSVSIVVVWLDVRADSEKPWRQMREALDDLEADLPELCQRPEVNTNLAETAGMIIALSGARYDYDQLSGFAEVFERELARVDGIARIDVVGALEKQVDVRVETARINGYGLSFEDLATILRAQNVEIPSGSIERDGVKLAVTTPGVFESLHDIEQTIVDVSPQTGAPVRVRDLATVSMGLEDGRYKIRQNGARAVLLAGYFESGRNIVLVGKDVRAILDRVKQRFPPDLQVDEVVFYPEDVQVAVAGFMRNLLQGVLLVIVVVFLGMGFRNAMVVSLAIPLSVLVSFVVMNLMGLQIHQISTSALIIALGMLVDNAIVIADSIQVRIDAGVPNETAAFEGARESAIPVFTATLTTVAAYSPLMFLPGSVGDFILTIPQVVMVSLSASYLVAMLVTPTLGAMFFRPTSGGTDDSSRLRRGFAFLLAWGLRHKAGTLLIALAVFGAALTLQSRLGLSFFPYSDKNMAYVNVEGEIADFDRTEALAAQAEAILAQTPEITSITTAIGEGLPKFFVSMPQHAQAEDYAQIMFRYDLGRSDRFASNEELVFYLHQQLGAAISGATVSVKLLELADPSAAPVVVRVSGDDYDRLLEVSQQLQARLSEVPGAIDVKDDALSKALEFRVLVDDDVATNLGITKYDIQRQINIALYGGKATVFRKAGKEYDIRVKSDIQSLSELENLAIKSRVAGHKVLLKQIAHVELAPRVELITRYQRDRSIAVTAFVAPGFASPAIEGIIERDLLPGLNLDGVSISFDGEREKIKKNFGNVGMSSLVALAAVYLILLLQFNSFRQPLIILVTVPLSAIGSIIGLFLVGQSMSFTALLGMASLIGIVVNNAILLIDFINRARERGDLIDAACVDAVQRRLRPIGLSTLTTVVGLTPLMLSNNPLFYPMSISLMSGLAVSTLLTMVVIPVVISLTHRDVPQAPRVTS